jgi:hypothetical protein
MLHHGTGVRALLVPLQRYYGHTSSQSAAEARMMTKLALVRMTFSFLAALLLTGCGADYFRAETTLNPDGSVERAIYQPRADTPESAQEQKHWERVFRTDKISRENWSGTIRERTPAGKLDESCYVAAWGRFASADEIPEHYVYPLSDKLSSDESRQSRLERRVEKIDYGFVVEHRWQETLTNTVQLDDMHKARRELADLLITLVEEIGQEAYGAEYDFAPLIAWFGDEGTIWFEELTDLLFELGVRKELDDEELCMRRVAEICARHGLVPLSREAAHQFVDAKIRELIHRKDGTPLEETTVSEIRKWLDLDDHPEQEEAEEKKPTRLEVAAERIIERKYGVEKAFEKRLAQLGSRIVGVHFIHFPPVRFDYSLTMPGTIITTNGTLMSDNNVQWSFDADESFPFGYVMSCRSLTVREELQQQLLKNEPLADRASQVRYVGIVTSAQVELRTVLSRCAVEESLDPLTEYRTKVGSKEFSRVQKLWRLLQLSK